MSEAQEDLEGKISHASGLIAASKGKMKIRQAMKLVGFSTAEVETMRIYQKVRRQSMRMIVVDKSAVARGKCPVPQGNIGSGDTVTSTLSSAERTNVDLISPESLSDKGNNSNNSGTDDSGTNDNRVAPTPRQLLGTGMPSEGEGGGEVQGNKKRSGDKDTTCTASTKRSRRSSKEVHRVQAHVIMQTKKEADAMKQAMTRIDASNKLEASHPDKKSINQIVKEVNDLCGSNISPKTVGKYVRAGMINVSPLKRGPVGPFSKAILESLKWAHASFLQLEQAEGRTQSTMKDMAKRVNACVNLAGFTKCRDDLTRKLRNLTADLFTVGKSNRMEHRRLQWTTHQNLDFWFSTFKVALIDLGFGREALPEEDVVGEIFFYEGQLHRVVNLDETDGSLDDATGNKGGRPPVIFSNPDLPNGAVAANKSGYSSTVICGSNAAGEALPPHFQLKTMSQSDSTQKLSVDWFVHAVDVRGKFGLESEQVLRTTFGMNERGGMNAIELDKYIKKAILPLYPDAADVPGKRALLKLDSAPGRMNLDMLAPPIARCLHHSRGTKYNTCHPGD